MAESLTGDDLDLYTFTARRGHTYRFCTMPNAANTCAPEAEPGVARKKVNNVAELLIIGPDDEVEEGITRNTQGLEWTVPDDEPTEATYVLVVRRRARFEGSEPAYSYKLKHTIPSIMSCSDLRAGAVSGAQTTTTLYICTPATPTISSSVTRTNAAITFKWSSASVPIEYMVRLTKGASVGDPVAPNNHSGARSHRFTGLDANTEYKVEVKAINKIGGITVAESGWASVTTTTLRPDRPMDKVFSLPPTTITETRWIRRLVPPFGQCNEFEQQRTKTTTVTIHVTYSWDGTGWRSAVHQSESVSYTMWQPTSGVRVCDPPTRRGAWVLQAGEYELQWETQQVSFTVPANQEVELRSRRLGSGEDAAVFSVADGAELVVTPDMLAEDAVTGLSEVSDPTLASLSSSLEPVSADTTPPIAVTETQCAEAAKPESGAVDIDVADDACVIMNGGGAARVSDGTRTLNLTLPTGRDWLLFASSEFSGSAAGAFLFLDLTTGGWVALNPADGAELARHAPADADGLPALLDAIAASASAPAAAE